MEWISIKDNLPPEGLEVLVYSNKRGITSDHYTGQIVDGVPEFYGDREEWDFDVTHWQILPSSPTNDL